MRDRDLRRPGEECSTATALRSSRRALVDHYWHVDSDGTTEQQGEKRSTESEESGTFPVVANVR
jgi:hypothetical protein